MIRKISIQKTRLIELLIGLSDLELKRLIRYVKSPYQNTNKAIIRLLEILKKFHPDFSSEKLSKAFIHKKLYPDLKFKDARIHDVFNKTLRLTESFLIGEYLEKEVDKRTDLLIEILAQKSYSLFQKKAIQRIEQITAKEPWKTADDYYHLYRLQQHLWYHPNNEKFTPKQDDLLDSQRNLDAFYRFRKEEFITALTSRANFLNTDTADLLTDLKKQYSENDQDGNKEYILLFNKMTQLLEHGNLADYHELKKFVKAVFPKLGPVYQQNYIVQLINFAIHFQLKTDDFPANEIFKLYQFAVAEKTFIQDGRLRDIEFTNICISGFNIQEVEWTNQFIEDHLQYLKKEEQKYLVPFVRAYNKLFSKDYEGVIYLLRDVQPKNNLKYLARIQSLLIRAFFECELLGIGSYKKVLNSYLVNLKSLMERNSANTTIRKDAYLNFVSFIRKLIPLLDAPDYPIEGIKKKLKATKPIHFKKWLMEKLETFESIKTRS